MPQQPAPEIDQALNQAAQLGQTGQLDRAATLCQQILQRYPQTAQAWHLLGLCSLQQGQHAVALAHLEKAIALEPNKAEFHNHAGVVHYQLGNFEAGISCYQQALVLQPQSIDTRYNLALGLQKLGRLDEAIQEYRQLIAQQPHHAPALYQLGNIFQQQDRFVEAIAHYRQTIAIQPQHAQAWYSLGVALQAQGEATNALAAYQQALTINPRYAEAHTNLGILYQERGQATQAIARFSQALALKPDYIPALINLGNVRLRLEQLSEAETTYRKVLSLDPNNLNGLDGLLKTLLETCQWSEIEALTRRLWEAFQNQPGEISPYTTLFLPLSAAQQQAIAQKIARATEKKVANLRRHLNFTFQKAAGENSQSKIRLGYVSGDFRDHAVAQLMLRLFELHDRQDFEVFAYSLGPDDGSKYRQKLMADCDCFRDISKLTAASSAQQIHQDDIDILIDLAGYTEYACSEIFALRPAPLQINYLGYPGTLGADYIDYIITDPVVTPPALANYFTEQCLYLTDSYQINNNQQPLPGEIPSKASLGLPEDTFVYCCFNKVSKIEPTIFAAWMRILRQVHNSVLWLLEASSEAQKHLTAAAKSVGIAPERLIFASRLPNAQHLKRLQAADLFLDTLYYNAHVTASDALWVGVPLLALPGETFASRVTASLLNAVGLPELITSNLEEYEYMAVHLANHPDELEYLKDKLVKNRLHTPLFDTPRTVRQLEETYRRIWQIYHHSTPLPQGQRTREDRFLSPLSTPHSLLPTPESSIACHADEGFQAWMAQVGGSIIISTYQAGKVAMVSWNGQQVTVLLRQFTKPMGIAVKGDRLAVATQHEVVLLANAQSLAYNYLEDQPGRYDALYLPRTTYFTGDLNIHDLAFGSEGLWMVNSRFSCLAALSEEFSFIPRWQPPFISELVPEDRCHLNGLAMVEGKPKYVTALGESDVVGGWRANKARGGILIDVETNEILLRGLSMPHSPRWHQGKLWFLNSGTGELCRVDLTAGEIEVVCVLPGFGRGLCLLSLDSDRVSPPSPLTSPYSPVVSSDYALVGLSQMRETNIFGGLPLQERFEHLACGMAVVDLHTGERMGLFEFTSGCQELYDVQFLQGISRPILLNNDKPAVREAFTAPQFAYWLRSSTLIREETG
jgi:uncharacterized protein (TIGR03032 family)